MAVIRLYLDEDVSDDPDQLKYAAKMGYIIVTHNRGDFQALATEWFELGFGHAGIILAVRRPPGLIVDRLLGIIGSFSAEEMRDQIIYI